MSDPADLPASDNEVAGYVTSLGLRGLIDVHTHFMPDQVLNKVWAYFDAVGPLTGIEWPIVYREDEHSRLKRLQALGVTAFTALLYPHKAGMATWLNTWAAEFADRTPGCLHTATFFPEPAADAYVADALAAGARVFKAHLQVGGYDPRDPLLRPVWQRIAAAGVPVVVHCGSGPQPGAFTGPGPMSEVLGANPELVLVVAHMGMPEYADFAALAASYPRVYLDTTMAFTDFVEALVPYPRDLLPTLAKLGDRVLFGSDFPNIPHPYAHQVTAVARLGLGDAWLRKVFYENAAALFSVGSESVAE